MVQWAIFRTTLFFYFRETSCQKTLLSDPLKSSRAAKVKYTYTTKFYFPEKNYRNTNSARRIIITGNNLGIVQLVSQRCPQFRHKIDQIAYQPNKKVQSSTHFPWSQCLVLVVEATNPSHHQISNRVISTASLTLKELFKCTENLPFYFVLFQP